MSDVLPKRGPTPVSNARPVPANDAVLDNLGLLRELAGGTWVGHGFNLVARPDKQENAFLYLELNQTRETLTFEAIGSRVPNRGFAQDNIDLYGLTYKQKISDFITGDALHIEPGIWVRQPNTTAPAEQTPQGVEIVSRMGSIPHGNSILASGTAQPFDGRPTLADGVVTYKGSIFPSFNSSTVILDTPIFAAGSSERAKPAVGGAPAGGFPAYTLTNLITPPNSAGTAVRRTPAGNVPEIPLPAAIDGVPMQAVIDDPIKLLQAVIARQIDEGFHHSGVAINISSKAQVQFTPGPNVITPPATPAVVNVLAGGGGIENISFLQTNANSGLVYATFWIESLTHPQRAENILQLQYAQMVLLNFPILGAPAGAPVISWPHISVATLHKVFG